MKRTLAVAATLGLALAAISPLAGAAPKQVVVIEDAVDDANGINDQGLGDGTVGDVGGADPSTVTDILSVSLANDAKNLYITIEAQNAPPATQGVAYRFRANPDGPGGAYCLIFEGFYSGVTTPDMTQFKAHMRDACGDNEPIEIGVIGGMFTVPRKLHEGLGKGATLTAPQAQTMIYSGNYPDGVAAPTMDTTKVGTDYKLVDKKKKK
ncbi:MAG: hypothetical protein ABR575_07395 [Actinomycetota bacterium]